MAAPEQRAILKALSSSSFLLKDGRSNIYFEGPPLLLSSLELSGAKVHEPSIRARLGSTHQRLLTNRLLTRFV